MKNKEIKIPKDAIIMLVGISGVGKSAISNKFSERENTIVVSSDACRKELSGDEADQTVSKEAFELFYKKIEEGLQNKKQVVADATHLSDIARNSIYKIAEKYNIPVYALIFNVPLYVAKKQNAKRERIVPDFVLEKQFENLERVYKKIRRELPAQNIIDIISLDKSKDKNSFEI